jgi:glutamate formiminotransferase/formiminotetrahydrofolate cyclodeaminase
MSLVECVPNFSEGRDRAVIDAIAQAIRAVDGVKLLDVDPGADTNRTVYTFVGNPEGVGEAAFRAASKAVELIDMSRHRGAHPRIGSMDVCPFVPVADITMAECALLARRVGRRIGDTLGVPVYFYEHAAAREERRSLATIRAGEYEGLPQKLADPQWAPDAGPASFNPRAGAFVVGAREFLIAYNINLNTTDRRLAHDIALSIRETGRLLRDEAGEVVRDDLGRAMRTPGRLKAVRAIGWYISEYRQAQVSINLLDFHATPLHVVFETVREEADTRGLLVTGSELVGLTPLEPLLAAGRYFLRKQRRSAGVPEAHLLDLAVRSLGLGQLAPFDPGKKVIEYQVRSRGRLAQVSVDRFVDEVSADTPTPGGGSAAALAGSLGAALAAMVANLTTGKKGYEAVWDASSSLAEQAQALKAMLVAAIDADAAAFDGVLEAMRLPKSTPEEERARAAAMARAAQEATRIPLETAGRCADAAWLAAEAAASGSKASASDAGVAALLARSGAEGAALNVLTNLPSIDDPEFRARCEREAAEAVRRARDSAEQAIANVREALGVTADWLSRRTV